MSECDRLLGRVGSEAGLGTFGCAVKWLPLIVLGCAGVPLVFGI